MHKPLTAPTLAMSIREAAQSVGLSERKVWQLIHDGQLRASRVGRNWLVEPAAIRELLAATEQKGGAAAS